MKTRRLLFICLSVLLVAGFITVLLVLSLREEPKDPTVDIFTNDNSVYSGKIIDNAYSAVSGTALEVVAPSGQQVFSAQVDSEVTDSYTMLIYKNGESHDLYLQGADSDIMLVYSGFDPEGDPMVYRYTLGGQVVYIAHVPAEDGTYIYFIHNDACVLQCQDYDMHDVDLDGEMEVVTYAGEAEEQVVLLDFNAQGVFQCDVAQVTGADQVSFYYRSRISFFECKAEDQYPAFFSVRGGQLVERDRPLAVYEDYLYPNSSTERLSYSDLYNMYSSTVAFAYNEIAARHGCIFVDQDFQSYFETTRWYVPVEGFSEANLTAVEQFNSVTIRSYMNNVNANAYNSNSDYSSADLDGDGISESISVSEGKLFINQESADIFDGMNYMYFHVVDVNIEMRGFQIAVVGYNSDARFVAEIFEYQGGKPVSAGVIAGYNDISYPGDGHIVAKVPCGLLYDDIMQDVSETYSLKDGSLLPDDVDVYQLIQLLETRQPLTLYDSMSTSSKSVTVAAEAEVVILATDRTNWLFIQAETGETGWLYCADGQVDGVDIQDCFYDLIGGY